MQKCARHKATRNILISLFLVVWDSPRRSVEREREREGERKKGKQRDGEKNRERKRERQKRTYISTKSE